MTAKLRLELPLLLPEIDGAADACVTRLVESLSAREGVRNAHIVAAAGEDSAKLCVHYDPDLLSLPRIREIAQSEGAKITERFGHLLWNVDGLSNQRRARTVAFGLALTIAAPVSTATRSPKSKSNGCSASWASMRAPHLVRHRRQPRQCTPPTRPMLDMTMAPARKLVAPHMPMAGYSGPILN